MHFFIVADAKLPNYHTQYIYSIIDFSLFFRHNFTFRYGLPVNFQAILIHPHKKSVKRLREVLNQLYSHLDGSASAPSSNADVSLNFIPFSIGWQINEINFSIFFQNVDIPGLGFGQSEYYPYVHYKLNIDMVESKI